MRPSLAKSLIKNELQQQLEEGGKAPGPLALVEATAFAQVVDDKST